jgi:hypothetical protein
MLLKSILSNYLFFMSLIISVYVLTKPNLIIGYISLIILIFNGYLIHYVSHLIDAHHIYTFLKNNYLYNLPNIIHNYFYFLAYLFDFHSKVHHDSKVNTKIENIIMEIIQNFVTQGGYLLPLCFFIKDLLPVILLWTSFYITAHHINYNIIKNNDHEKHHLNYKTNYGIDTMDILFGTRYDNKFENMNHYSINVVIITCILYLMKYKLCLF